MYRGLLQRLQYMACLALLVSPGAIGATGSAECEYASGNLLADPGFKTLTLPKRERAWRYSQHSRDLSFEYSAEQGILEMVKTGKEPWALLAQSVDVGLVRGKRIEFSAELELALTEPADAHGFGYGGGLSLLAKQGSRVVFRSRLEHEPRMGTHDWQRVSTVVDLPIGITYFRVGFLHQAGGEMQVRDPALRTVASGCSPSVVHQ
ncbi:MAG: hypothetical protein AAGA91_07320 [Pseudomonadota bacterium]